jgi:hypothetical protein
LLSAPAPLIAWASVTVLPFVSSVPPPGPNPVMREEMSAVLPVAHCRPPPFKMMPPVPKLPAEVKLIRPPEIVVPPE